MAPAAMSGAFLFCPQPSQTSGSQKHLAPKFVSRVVVPHLIRNPHIYSPNSLPPRLAPRPVLSESEGFILGVISYLYKPSPYPDNRPSQHTSDIPFQLSHKVN